MYNNIIDEQYTITIINFRGSENRTLSKQSGGIIPFDEGNSDYQRYLKWIEQGNEATIVDNR
jgi:hypothetical protein